MLIENGCKIRRNGQGLTPIDDCCQEYLKKVFHQYGFTENDDYQQNPSLKNINPNKIERQIIGSNGLTHQDFIYYKKIGRGTFG